MGYLSVSQFVTNRGTHTAFASWRPKPASSDHSYLCVHKPDKDRASLYYAAFGWEQRLPALPGEGGYYAHLALEQTERVEPRDWPSSFVPASPPIVRRGRSRNQYFSSCRLENAVEVVPCRSRLGGVSANAVTGLLVRYANGDRACVGSFRFDWAGETCEVGRGGRLYIGCGRHPESVRDVRNEPPPVDNGLSWLEVPLSGKLEWWSLAETWKVYHIRDAVDAQG